MSSNAKKSSWGWNTYHEILVGDVLLQAEGQKLFGDGFPLVE